MRPTPVSDNPQPQNEKATNLNYDASYHLHCRLQIASGMAITLTSIHQSMTYSGWLEGVPSTEWNDQIIEETLARAARQHCFHGGSPYLIAPERRDFLRRPGDMNDSCPSRPAEWLPLVSCIASFKSVFPARSKTKDLSYATVVWFQGEYCFPIDETVLKKLQEIDWDGIAADVEI
ncbi:MAG: hypothetical protein JST44_02565 [Cyanobacteria bacterium SZAS LIN-5]|nr:hypothetical protein [Cyanobacteria bacterium SZAS LIN-5]RTL38454.1 MAG: hypothetical protein EKK48_21345 [Candidatus Melainabacteria bacterium]